jgi:3-oxoacyl-[acyl-carrier-protein] synthase II
MDGDGAYRCMSMALKRAGISASELDYINAHGTSTPLGDEIELGAVKRLFGNAIETVSMSSTKSAIGHLLGAAGAVEAIYSVLSINHDVVPPTLNLEDPSDACLGVDLVPRQAKARPVRAALSNSFGFGGTNASLVFREYV